MDLQTQKDKLDLQKLVMEQTAQWWKRRIRKCMAELTNLRKDPLQNKDRIVQIENKIKNLIQKAEFEIRTYREWEKKNRALTFLLLSNKIKKK